MPLASVTMFPEWITEGIRPALNEDGTKQGVSGSAVSGPFCHA